MALRRVIWGINLPGRSYGVTLTPKEPINIILGLLLVISRALKEKDTLMQLIKFSGFYIDCRN